MAVGGGIVRVGEDVGDSGPGVAGPVAVGLGPRGCVGIAEAVEVAGGLVSVGDLVRVGVLVREGAGVADGVQVGVKVEVCVADAVAVGVGVSVAVAVAVGVGVSVAVGVSVVVVDGVAVSVGVDGASVASGKPPDGCAALIVDGGGGASVARPSCWARSSASCRTVPRSIGGSVSPRAASLTTTSPAKVRTHTPNMKLRPTKIVRQWDFAEERRALARALRPTPPPPAPRSLSAMGGRRGHRRHVPGPRRPE